MTNRLDSTRQHQFLNVIDRDEAERRFHAAIDLSPRDDEQVELKNAWGRILARDVRSGIDVPSFDRSNVDGFAIRAGDTVGAIEERPIRLSLLDETIASAVVPQSTVRSGTAVPIATGAMLPRGADAVVMIEHTDADGTQLMVRKSVTPGAGVAFAGTDIGAGETVLRRGDRLTSRETGVLAAIGIHAVHVVRRPRVAILSTGDELIAPGQPMRPGRVFDSNSQILADAVRELGGEPLAAGIIHDNLAALQDAVADALNSADIVLLSGGTSKGAGDLSYQVVQQMSDPGIVAHGVALKPGKPICLAASQNTPIVILPGFPTSAVFTFHEFIAPVIRQMALQPQQQLDLVPARLATKVNSEIGRTEYLLVGLVQSGPGQDDSNALAAYPMGKGSGSVTTFSRADGFVTLDRNEELVEQGRVVQVRLLGRDLELADLVVIGSHCVGLDYLLSRLQQVGVRGKFLSVGSTAGLAAAARGECDVAGVHLLDPATGQYNTPFLRPGLTLITGYCRRQGILFRRGDERFENRSAHEAVRQALQDAECRMVNRNQGSGTRILIDQLLVAARPDGYAVQARSHNSVAAAIAQGRADWGVAIELVARQSDLGFITLADEVFDFVIPDDRLERPSIKRFVDLLSDSQVQADLADLGLMLRADG